MRSHAFFSLSSLPFLSSFALLPFLFRLFSFILFHFFFSVPLPLVFFSLGRFVRFSSKIEKRWIAIGPCQKWYRFFGSLAKTMSFDNGSCAYIYIYIRIYIYRYSICDYWRKFRSQTSDNMDRWKAEMGRGREKRRVEESRSEKRKSQKKEDADARKGRKVAKHCVFPCFSNDLWLQRVEK